MNDATRAPRRAAPNKAARPLGDGALYPAREVHHD